MTEVKVSPDFTEARISWSYFAPRNYTRSVAPPPPGTRQSSISPSWP